MIRYVLLAASLLLVGSVDRGAAVGRSEIPFRESDVVFSGSGPLEVVVRLPEAPAAAGRVDAAWIEVKLDVAGVAETFVPFLLVAEAVVSSGQAGEYEPTWTNSAREVILQPASGQTVRMDANGLTRRWQAAGGELYLRIRVVESAGSEYPSEGVQLRATNGVLGRVVLVTR